MSDLLLPSSSFLESQVNDGAIVHVIIRQRVGIFDENSLENQTQHEISVFKASTFIFNNIIRCLALLSIHSLNNHLVIPLK